MTAAASSVVGRLTIGRTSLREPATGELIGHDGGTHVVELRDPGGDAVGRAVVEQAMPTGGESPSREQDGQLGLFVGHCLGREFEHGPAEPPVFAFLDVERQSSEPKPTPLGHELRRYPAVQREVHRSQLVSD